MAQNRLLVRCVVCGAETSIARVSAGEAHWTPARGEALGAEWAAFLVAHEHDDGLNVELTSENDFLIGRSLEA